MNEKERIRERQIEVFNAFTKRALQILGDDDDKRGTLADATRLVDTALKAVQGDTSTQTAADTESDRIFCADIARGYHKAETQTQTP